MDPTRSKGSRTLSDPRIPVIPDIHGHAKGEHRPYAEERPISYSARMLFLWFYHACRRGSPFYMMVSDHINYLTFEDPGAVHTVRRALKLAHAGDLYGAAETAGVDFEHARVVSEGLRRGMKFSIGAEVDNDPRARPDAQNIVEAMRPDGIIRTVHFVTIDHPEKGAEWPWPIDNAEFAHLFDHVGTEKAWELYVEKLLDDVDKLPGNVIGNFYLPAAFGHWPAPETLEAYEDRLLEAALARGMAVEINTRFLYRDNPEDQKKKYVEAISRLMKKAHEKGVGIAIGSAAHSPKDQGNAFDVILPLLDEFGVNEVVFPVAGRLARVVLRATKEHLEQHEKRRESVSPGSSITGFSRAELGLPEEIATPSAGRTRAARPVGPKKRTADATRPAKRTESSASTVKSSSKRTAESSTSSSKAKAARAKSDDAPAAPQSAAKPAAPKAPSGKSAPPKAKAVKAAKPAVTAKPAVAKPAKSKAAAKPVKKAAAKPAAKAAVKKAPAPKKAPAAKKPVAKKAAPPKKAASKRAPAAKPPAKKSPAKPAAKPKKTAAKSAAKPAAKKPVKKAAKPAPKRR